MEEPELTSSKSFKTELKTNKNNTYEITFSLGKEIEIEAIQITNLIKKSFGNVFSFHQIQENKYFLQFDSLNEIFDELKERINAKDKISVEENESDLKINVPLLSSKNKEIIFELKQKTKNEKENIKDLTKLITKQNNEIVLLKKELTQLKEKETQSKNEIEQIKSEITKLNNENTQLKNKDNQLQI